MRRMVAALCGVMLAVGVATAQVGIKAPADGTPTGLTIVTLVTGKTEDVKTKVLFNGKDTAPGTFLNFKNDDGDRVLLLNNPAEGSYTFVAAGVLDGKTDLATHVLVIQPSAPKPPTPTPPTPPAPTPGSTLAQDIRAAYAVSPDAASLAKLQTAFEGTLKANYLNYDAMETTLRGQIAAAGLAQTDLRKVRDLISAHLLKTLGDDPRRVSIDKGKAALSDVLTALKAAS